MVEPLIPAIERRYRFPVRKHVDDRKVSTEILFVLHTGIPWEHLPQEMGCGSGMTCWRRLREADRIDWSRAMIDRSHARAVWGARRPVQAR